MYLKFQQKEEEIQKKNWEEIHKELKIEVGQVAYKSWLIRLKILGFTQKGELFLSLPTEFLRDWVVNHYYKKIEKFCKNYFKQVKKIEIIISAGSEFKALKHFQNEDVINNESSSPLDPRFTFKNFVVGKSNELAFAAAKRVSENNLVSFNPLFLFGGVGLGKTHLMHAIAWDIKERDPKRRVVYLSAEKFMYEFVKSLRYKDTMSFKEKFRSVDVLMIDDIQFIAGKESTQEEFFHTFNSLVGQSKQIIISGDRAPSDLDGLEERLQSRLSFGLVGEIHKADYELRLSILHTKIEARKDVSVDEEIIKFLAKKISSNVRELEGALRRLVAHSELVNRPINLQVAQQLLHDLLRANNRKVTVEDIQKKVADYFNIRFNDMVSVRRSRIVARPRQVAMYLSKNFTPKSLPEIGRMFGGRDHTTVMHAIKKVQELCKVDPSFAEHIKVLKRTLDL
ncbi:MAG: Chromosomal replication initiator protein DnaA [Alphaproteobacteria bacterium MarineAlpha9_Bin4]|nr:chromosomal replication initiator protein DnaA [Pelagibacterales bacterium]PPR27238.1 MAG: Chromosomal replication initiator protein DnaA [Alphaproteobacteria bacterium MarineAlpha9_Bin4]